MAGGVVFMAVSYNTSRMKQSTSQLKQFIFQKADFIIQKKQNIIHIKISSGSGHKNTEIDKNPSMLIFQT
ncbi:hypothetical protein ACE1TI_12915 [Alteribacillus sp. JSM 102045]|uniref:hypothetical protein n=1 Tax=Alteribacillus sp. JSM 102045 TaxID=1562101 RepID=UPI0035BFB874